MLLSFLERRKIFIFSDFRVNELKVFYNFRLSWNCLETIVCLISRMIYECCGVQSFGTMLFG